MNQTEPLIDVVLCTANRDDPGLVRSLKSLDESNFKKFRLLLVNDSRSSLPKNLPLGSLNVRIIDIGKNVGLTRALKAAETFLSANFVARMDCGDTMLPDRLARQYQFLLQNPKCVLVGVRSEFLVRRGADYLRIGYSRSSENIRNIASYLLWRNPFVHGSIMFRRAEFLMAGGYDVNFRIAQDFNLYMRMRSFGELYILPDVLYVHRFNLDSSSTVKNNKSSLLSSLRSRLILSKPVEYLNPLFFLGLVRDFFLLLLPSIFLRWLRFGRCIKRVENVTN